MCVLFSLVALTGDFRGQWMFTEAIFVDHMYIQEGGKGKVVPVLN
jgi:hypothetical protein